METTLTLRNRLGFNEVALWKQFCARRLHLIHTLSLNLRKASEQEEQVRVLAAELCAEYGFGPYAQTDFEKLLIAGIQSVRRNQKRSARNPNGYGDTHNASDVRSGSNPDFRMSGQNHEDSSNNSENGNSLHTARHHPNGKAVVPLLSSMRLPGQSPQQQQQQLGNNQSGSNQVRNGPKMQSQVLDQTQNQNQQMQQQSQQQSQNESQSHGQVSPLSEVPNQTRNRSTSSTPVHSPDHMNLSQSNGNSKQNIMIPVHSSRNPPEGPLATPMFQSLVVRLEVLRDMIGAGSATWIESSAPAVAHMSAYGVLSTAVAAASVHGKLTTEESTTMRDSILEGPLLESLRLALNPSLTRARLLERIGALAASLVHGPHLLSALQALCVSLAQASHGSESDMRYMLGPLARTDIPHVDPIQASAPPPQQMPPLPSGAQIVNHQETVPPSYNAPPPSNGMIPTHHNQPGMPPPPPPPHISTNPPGPPGPLFPQHVISHSQAHPPGHPQPLNHHHTAVAAGAGMHPAQIVQLPPKIVLSHPNQQPVPQDQGQYMLQRGPHSASMPVMDTNRSVGFQPYALNRFHQPLPTPAPNSEPRHSQCLPAPPTNNQAVSPRTSDADNSISKDAGPVAPPQSPSAASLNKDSVSSAGSLTSTSSSVSDASSASTAVSSNGPAVGGIHVGGPDRLVTLQYNDKMLQLTYSPMKATPPTISEIIDNARQSFSIPGSTVVRIKDVHLNKIIETNNELIDAFTQPQVKLELLLPPPMLIASGSNARGAALIAGPEAKFTHLAPIFRKSA